MGEKLGGVRGGGKGEVGLEEHRLLVHAPHSSGVVSIACSVITFSVKNMHKALYQQTEQHHREGVLGEQHMGICFYLNESKKSWLIVIF